jgi:hypothetical protein
MINFKLSDIQTGGATGMDALLANDPQIVSPVGQAKKASAPKRVKIGSLQQLEGFQRVAADTLIHKSTQELWAIRKDGEDFCIERLFQDNGLPLKG